MVRYSQCIGTPHPELLYLINYHFAGKILKKMYKNKWFCCQYKEGPKRLHTRNQVALKQNLPYFCEFINFLRIKDLY